MSKRWYQENRRDPWRREARSKGYRARSAYKLKQIQDKFGIIRKGDSVLDVGCHPGGWTQVAVEEVGENGFVYAIEPDPNNLGLLRSNITENNFDDRCEIIECAMSDEDGELSFWMAEAGPNLSSVQKTKHSTKEIVVPSYTLNTFLKDG